MTTDKNRFVAEKLGLCWHEWDWREASQTYRCTKCNKYLMNMPVPTNPDFMSDAGTVQLLRLMMKHFGNNDYNRSQFLFGLDVYGTKPFILRDFITLITTPGKLLQTVYEWAEEHPR